MSETLSLIKNVKEYTEKYSLADSVNAINAQEVAKQFLDNQKAWRCFVGQLIKDEDGEIIDGDDKYGHALTIYSASLRFLEYLRNTDVEGLQKLVCDYEQSVKYMFGYKYQMWLSLGLCWHKLGKVYDNMTIAAFKKYLFYLLTQYNHTSYYVEAYSFRSCSTYLYQSLVNETLNLSSPAKFNDPFDCPIISVLDTDDEVDKLMRTAYLDCIKVACFVKNTKLPYLNSEGNCVICESKSKKSIQEYLNPLMWAHYADSHRGVCIKYNFSNEITHFGRAIDSSFVNFFGDVNYTNNLAMDVQNGKLTISDAFFAKGKCWEYENELRLLYCNPDEKDQYVAFDVPNSIRAVYFGLECSQKDRETIMNILKSKKCLVKNRRNNKMYKRKILFYQISKDPEHFGELISNRI